MVRDEGPGTTRRALAAGALGILAAGRAGAQGGAAPGAAPRDPPRRDTLRRDSVRLGTNWVAEAEHGGYYQALAEDLYAGHGLDVTIVPGGPQANNRLLLAAGRIDFLVSANMLQAFSAVEQGIPTLVVAAHFQRDPIVLMSHPGQGLDRFEDLKGASRILIGADGLAGFYRWLRTDHGFREDNVRPYAFSPAPFIADPRAVQQGYATSEPLAVEEQGGFEPNVFLLADHGFDGYATTIEARRDLVEARPDLVRRFLDASALGWYGYLYGDNAAANALIRRDNPEMTERQIAFGLARMKADGIVDSGDSLRLGIGAMTHERVRGFFARMVRAGLFAPGLDVGRSYTLDFVNRGVGLERRPRP